MPDEKLEEVFSPRPYAVMVMTNGSWRVRPSRFGSEGAAVKRAKALAAGGNPTAVIRFSGPTSPMRVVWSSGK
jgi:hypothetical protein